MLDNLDGQTRCRGRRRHTPRRTRRPCRGVALPSRPPNFREVTNLVVHFSPTTTTVPRQPEREHWRTMPRNTYKIAEARAQFSKLLTRARAGEEIVITKGREPYARIVPPIASAKREEAPLHHLRLPDDLFDHEDAEQAAIDAGDHTDTLGIWCGGPSPS